MEAINALAFNLAHWQFAFHYWALSWRVELILSKKSPDIYNRRLNIVNFVGCLITTVCASLILTVPDLTNYEDIFEQICTSCLFVYLIFLVWGFYRLIKLLNNKTDHPVSKSMIFWHIIAYALIITARGFQNFRDLPQFKDEIYNCCVIVVSFFCTEILALIVNQIVSKDLELNYKGNDTESSEF